jgi:hypothetical protein
MADVLEMCDTDAQRDQLIDAARPCLEAALVLLRAAMLHSVAGHVDLALHSLNGTMLRTY